MAVGESKVVPFEGTYLRTAAITGQVTVEGNPLDGVTVSIQGRGEDRSVTTNGAGQFTFSELRSGDYSVGISGFDIDQYGFEVTAQTVTVAHGETATVPFAGILLRSATIMGTVTVEGTGIPNVLVTVHGNGEEEDARTNAAGQYSIADLHAGEYSVGISGFDDDEYGFDATTSTVTVELQQTTTVLFDGIMLRTAGIEGTVTVDDHALPGVTVTISGGLKGEGHTRTTNDAGYYMVDRLHAGDYAVAISDFDATEYEFPATTESISVGLRETETVAFQGELLRTAGISGRVSVEGMGLDGILVTMSGDAAATALTADGGQYSFAGLAGGDYKVAIAGWDEAAYSFEMTDAEVPVDDGAAVVQNFDGVHTRTASVSGMLFLDEVNSDGMYTDGEPALAHAGIPLLLQGLGVNDVQYGMSMEDGSYAFEGLRAGRYRVLLDLSEELLTMLGAGGFHFSGEVTGAVVSVDAAMAATVNFPFRIVTQTIFAGAVMGNATTTGDPVGGVELELYPTAEALANDTDMLGKATTDSTGAAKFDFPRAMDLGPGGQGTDHLVFVKVTGTGHDDLVVSDNAEVEIEYAVTDRSSQATTAVRLLNQGVNFQWWVKSNADAKDGNEFLGGWKVVMGTDTIATGEDGKATYSGTAALDDMPAKYTIMADGTQADSLTMGEDWTQPEDGLVYTHNPLALPAMNTAEMNDLGAVFVTFTTQTLTVGVYREADDVKGYSNYRSGLPRGDHRPAAGVAREMFIELLERDGRNQLRRYTWDPHPVTGEDRKAGWANVGSDGMVSFTGIPADAELTVRFQLGSSDRIQVDYGFDEVETFGDDLDFGSSLGGFGEMSGAGPEVRLCSSSQDTGDDCATFGYQWQTGTISGNVGRQRGHEVVLAPETGHGATGGERKTGTGGAYAFTGLRDGEYSATASGAGDYTVDGAPTRKGLVVYHDEYIDDNDATTTYVGTSGAATASWDVTKGGLAIMGYVANDGDDNNLVRGDEAVAGITVNLLTDVKFYGATDGADKNGKLKSSKTAQTTETADNGLYSFGNLNDATKYWVQVVAGDAAGGYLSLRAKNPNLSGELAAQTYPALPEESTYFKPVWSRTTNSVPPYRRNVPITDDKGTAATTDDVTATLRNFGLVYNNGTVVGAVSNTAGSHIGIDVRITTNTDSDAVYARTTGRSGDFSVSGVMEGSYTAVIEDDGWAAPCMGLTGPDDDGPLDLADECTRAATSLTDVVSGRNDYASMGTLYVYSTSASAVDSLFLNPRVRGRLHGDGAASYNDTTPEDWVTAWNREPNTEVTASPALDGNISWASASVQFHFAPNSFPPGSSHRLMVGTKPCSGYTCTLEFNKTAAAGAGDSLPNTITVMVTAENGYDDHSYTVTVSRQAPVGNALGADQVLQVDADNVETAATVGDGTFLNPFRLSTTTASTASLNMRVALTVLGLETNDNQQCAQSLVVRDVADEAVTASDDDDDDYCSATRYNLAVAADGSRYTLHVTSQDGVPAVHHLALTRGP